MAFLNIALNKSATASGYVKPFAASNAVNGTTAALSRWLCNGVGPNAPATLSVNLNGLFIITSWVVKHMGVVPGWTSPNYNMVDFKLQGSLDNSTWYDLDSVVGNTVNTTSRTITSTTAYRYVRLAVTKGLNTNTQLASAVEFEVYGYTTPLLSGLTVSSGALAPAFSPTTYSYTTPNVPYATSSVNVVATSQDPTATIKVNGTTVSSGASTPALLNVGSNSIVIEVIGKDGQMKQTYTVAVTREQGATLSSLTISSGALNPTFASNILNYTTQNVGYDTASVTVTPTTNIAGCTITVNGATATSGQPSTVNLNVGSNTINVVVANAGASQTYTIAVVRCSPYLSGLSISSGPFKQAFSKTLYAYTATVANSVTSLTVTPTAEDTTATITVNSTVVASGSASAAIPLSEGTNTITVIVTPGVGTALTYTITAIRASSVVLSSITIVAKPTAGGTLVPDFDSAITSGYSITVPNGTSSLAVTAVAPNSSYIITVNNSPATSGVAKNIAYTTSLAIKVTYNSVSTTYTVTVSK